MERGIQSLLDEADALLMDESAANSSAFNESLSKIDHASDLDLSGMTLQHSNTKRTHS